MQKAFRDMNIEKSGFLSPYELTYVLEHWGVKLEK
jgi:hypothetical protein